MRSRGQPRGGRGETRAEIADLIARGFNTTVEIAGKLGVAKHTVTKHLERLGATSDGGRPAHWSLPGVAPTARAPKESAQPVMMTVEPSATWGRFNLVLQNVPTETLAKLLGVLHG